MIASIVFGVLALIGTILTTCQTLLTRRFRRRPHSFGEGLPFRQAGSRISILKPVCGLDDQLEENLISFTTLRGIDYEVIISAEAWDDPAVIVARRVMREHPDAPIRLVVDAGTTRGVVNRKVERLIAAAREATGDVFFISDSNVRVQPNDIARTVALLRAPRAGCVSNIFTAAGARTLGAGLESLHLLGFVLPGAVMADAARVPCVVGKSMAITRAVHDAIGGFERFRYVLAEDQAIGIAVKAAGFDVLLSSIVVRNVVVKRSVSRALDRQVRWNRIRLAFSPALYSIEPILNPWCLSVMSALFAADARHWLFPLFVLLARQLQFALLNRATRAQLSWSQLALVPLLDVLMLYGWIVAFASNRVIWRGHRARIGRGTQLIGF